MLNEFNTNWFWFDNSDYNDYDNVEDIPFSLLVDGIKKTLDAFYEKED